MAIAQCLEEWEPINERLITATILQCYALTNDPSEGDKEEFYEQLQAVKERIPKHDICIVMGDLNATVGDYNSYFARTMGKRIKRSLRRTKLIRKCQKT